MLDSVIHTLKGLVSSTNSLIGIGIAVLALVFFGVIIWVLTIDRRMRGMAEVLENERRKIAELQRSANVRNNGPARGYSGLGDDSLPAHSSANPRLGAGRRQGPSMAQQRASAQMAQQRQAAHAQQSPMAARYYDDYDGGYDDEEFTPEAQALYEQALAQAQHSRATSQTMNFGRGYNPQRALTDPSVSQQQAALYAQARARTDEAFRRAREHYEMGTEFSQEQIMQEYASQQEQAYQQYAAQQQAAAQRKEAYQQELQRQEAMRQQIMAQQQAAQQQAAYVAQQQAYMAQQYAAQQEAMQQQAMQQQMAQQQAMYAQQQAMMQGADGQQVAQGMVVGPDGQMIQGVVQGQYGTGGQSQYGTDAQTMGAQAVIQADANGMTAAQRAAQRGGAHKVGQDESTAPTISIAQRRNEEQRKAALQAHSTRSIARGARSAQERKAAQQAAVEQVVSRQAYLKNGDPRPVRPADAAKPTLRLSAPQEERREDARSAPSLAGASQGSPSHGAPSRADASHAAPSHARPSHAGAPAQSQPQGSHQSQKRNQSGSAQQSQKPAYDPRIPRAAYASPGNEEPKTGPTLDFMGRERPQNDEPIPVDVQAASSVGLYRHKG